MNDKDREAFEKWNNSVDGSPFKIDTWQAAVDYARKEQRDLLEKCENILSTIRQQFQDNMFYNIALKTAIKCSEILHELHEAGINTTERD